MKIASLDRLPFLALCVAFGCAGGPIASSRTAPAMPADPAPPGAASTLQSDGAFSPRSNTADVDGTNVKVHQDGPVLHVQETSIAINTTNPLNVIGISNQNDGGEKDSHYYVSHDGGTSWIDSEVPFKKYNVQGDPSVAFCGDGTAIMAYSDYGDTWRVASAYSTDGGDSFQGEGEARDDYKVDKSYVTCGPSAGAFPNRAYVTWMRRIGLDAGVSVSYSDDYGQTWSDPYTFPGSILCEGPVPLAGKDGFVAVLWFRQGDEGGIECTTSTDGGVSWSSAVLVDGDVDVTPDSNFRRPLYPGAAIDNSGGAHDGSIYVVWHDSRNGDADVFFSPSHDGGQTWGPTLRINDDSLSNGRDQYFPWVAVDDAGNIHAVWIDHRGRPGNEWADVYIATSRDGGESFDRNLIVNDVSFQTSLTGFFGDYIGIGSGGGQIFPLWPDLRSGTKYADVYVEVEPVFDYDLVKHVLFLDETTLTFEDQEPRLGTDIVYDILGGNVADLQGSEPWHLSWCVEDDIEDPPGTVSDTPSTGDAHYYLIRAEGPRGTGSFGSGLWHPDFFDGFDDNSPCSSSRY